MKVSSDRAPDAWWLVMPVKLLRLAKSRLAPVAGGERAELALAFALDTAVAALKCPDVAGVLAITDDPVAGPALRHVGTEVVGDEPDAGLNPALEYGGSVVASAHPGYGIGAISADLPALRPAQLSLALRSAAGYPVAVLSDAEGTGTTLYLAATPENFRPAFGEESLAVHVASGAYELPPAGLESVRRDVDTAEDLVAAVRLGVGPRTAAIVQRLRRLPTGRA